MSSRTKKMDKREFFSRLAAEVKRRGLRVPDPVRSLDRGVYPPQYKIDGNTVYYECRGEVLASATDNGNSRLLTNVEFKFEASE